MTNKKNKSNPRQKRKWRTIMIIACSILGIILLTVTSRIIYLSTPTKGTHIKTYEHANAALLVIDVQKDTTNMPQYKHTEELLANINSTIEQAKTSGMEIIYISQEFSYPLDLILSNGLYKEGSEGATFDERLEIVSDQSFSKARSDIFSNPDFDQYLIDHEISTLYIVGADASACVYKAALGAKNRGYDTFIVKDCIFSFSDNMYNKMLKQYEKNQIPTITMDSFLPSSEAFPQK